eukprot:GHVS01072597.1.p1 GENE.GHVS01072597.1~~GHVS01072597.1.p1  ORF type:complete len:103 (-),score=8.47 GHVS01072597.1:185-493(-)
MLSTKLQLKRVCEKSVGPHKTHIYSLLRLLIFLIQLASVSSCLSNTHTHTVQHNIQQSLHVSTAQPNGGTHGDTGQIGTNEVELRSHHSPNCENVVDQVTSE